MMSHACVEGRQEQRAARMSPFDAEHPLALLWRTLMVRQVRIGWLDQDPRLSPFDWRHDFQNAEREFPAPWPEDPNTTAEFVDVKRNPNSRQRKGRAKARRSR
ncbi:MAG: hypothetical protein KDA69_18755 [Planctomycetaceae bacterium]|nr:hypothetical protein [Planctomycetaceae bacterium]MCA9046373.1 hypothetical protein [Planctomycetaceae bacterium]